jgi:hypothetical protein
MQHVAILPSRPRGGLAQEQEARESRLKEVFDVVAGGRVYDASRRSSLAEASVAGEAFAVGEAPWAVF